MADERVSDGQKISSSPLRSARFVNSLVDVVDHHKRNALGRPGQRQNSRGLNGNQVDVKNLAGQDLARGSIVQLGEYLLDPMDIDNPWFEGNAPGEPYDKLAILQDPLKEDDIGPAFIAGACPALIEVIDEAHLFAIPDESATTLKSCECGPLKILQALEEPAEGTENQLVWVRFAHTGYNAKTTSAITARAGSSPIVLGTGTAELYGKVGGDLVATGISRTVWNSMGSEVPTATFIQLKVIGGELFVDVEDCT